MEKRFIGARPSHLVAETVQGLVPLAPLLVTQNTGIGFIAAINAPQKYGLAVMKWNNSVYGYLDNDFHK